jgi:hypothetical protein
MYDNVFFELVCRYQLQLAGYRNLQSSACRERLPQVYSIFYCKATLNRVKSWFALRPGVSK